MTPQCGIYLTEKGNMCVASELYPVTLLYNAPRRGVRMRTGPQGVASVIPSAGTVISAWLAETLLVSETQAFVWCCVSPTSMPMVLTLLALVESTCRQDTNDCCIDAHGKCVPYDLYKKIAHSMKLQAQENGMLFLMVCSVSK